MSPRAAPYRQPRSTGLGRLVAAVLTATLFAGAFAGVLRYGGSVGPWLAGAVGVLALCRLFAVFAAWRMPKLADIDRMDGLAFEAWVARLLEAQGFEVEITRGSGDLGVDLVAAGPDGCYAVQVKRQEAPVSRRAVSDAVAGRDHYDCDEAMVVTNSRFTRGAVELADSTGCVLVDRDELAIWMRGRR